MKHTQFRCHKAARYTDAEKTMHDDTIVVLRVVKEDLWWSTKSKDDALGILKDALRVIKDYDQRTFHSVISFSVRNELVSMICFVCKMQILLQQKYWQMRRKLKVGKNTTILLKVVSISKEVEKCKSSLWLPGVQILINKKRGYRFSSARPDSEISYRKEAKI